HHSAFPIRTRSRFKSCQRLSPFPRWPITKPPPSSTITNEPAPSAAYRAAPRRSLTRSPTFQRGPFIRRRARKIRAPLSARTHPAASRGPGDCSQSFCAEDHAPFQNRAPPRRLARPNNPKTTLPTRTASSRSFSGLPFERCDATRPFLFERRCALRSRLCLREHRERVLEPLFIARRFRLDRLREKRRHGTARALSFFA